MLIRVHLQPGLFVEQRPLIFGSQRVMLLDLVGTGTSTIQMGYNATNDGAFLTFGMWMKGVVGSGNLQVIGQSTMINAANSQNQQPQYQFRTIGILVSAMGSSFHSFVINCAGFHIPSSIFPCENGQPAPNQIVSISPSLEISAFNGGNLVIDNAGGTGVGLNRILNLHDATEAALQIKGSNRVSFSKSISLSNSHAVMGGGLSISNSYNVYFAQLAIFNNTALKSGGAHIANVAGLVIRELVVTNNTATTDCGGITFESVTNFSPMTKIVSFLVFNQFIFVNLNLGFVLAWKAMNLTLN